MKIPPPVFPREHGAWAVLLIPILSAALLTHSVNGHFILLLLATVMIFMSHSPLHVVLREFSDAPHQREKYLQARFWATAYLALAFVLWESENLRRKIVLGVVLVLVASSAVMSRMNPSGSRR